MGQNVLSHSAHLHISDSAGLGWGSQIHISSKFPGDAQAGLLSTLWEPLLYAVNLFQYVKLKLGIKS